MSTLLPTKFYLPSVPAGFVARPRLFEKLDQAPGCRLILVSAPAGAGKTTLISAWAQARRRQGMAVSWLSLDEGDNDPARFLQYLVTGLEEAGTVIDTASLPAMQKEQTGLESLLVDITQAVVQLNRDLFLILDDYHLIQNSTVHNALWFLLEHAPEHLHVVLSTRSDPPFALARFRMTGELLEIRMDNLRFSVQEAATFLQQTAGIRLAERETTVLTERTEGWIAGLQMAAISLRGREDASAFISAFAGSHRFVFDYLLEQVLNRQTSEIREFLLQTSILERLSAPLCEAVTGERGKAHSLLIAIERANLFLVPLDDERTWYRYHHMFAELLRLVLEETHPGLAPELHLRACRWYESQNDLPEALHHALQAGDMTLAARLVSSNVLALVEHAELAPILLRMDAASISAPAPLPWLEVAHAWALAYTGQTKRAEMALALAEHQLPDLPASEAGRMQGHILAVRAYLAWVHGDQPKAVELAMEAALLIPRDEFTVRALNITTLGNALVQYEADARAVEVLEQAVSLARQAGQSHVIMPAITALAYTHLVLGRFQNAHQTCLEAIEAAEAYQQHYGEPLPASASAYALLSNIYSEWGETEKAIQTARKGLALSELWGQADTVMLCLDCLAECLALTRNVEVIQAIFQRAYSLAQKVSPWFVTVANQAEMRFFLDLDDVSRATHLANELGPRLTAALEARLLVKQNRLGEAIKLVERALPEAMNTPSREAVRLGVTRALAYYLNKNYARALSALEETLALAEPENRLTTFVREGEPMAKLLRLAQTKTTHPAFVRRLLAACEAYSQPQATTAIETLIEPLSDRELEILQLLNGPLSTPEIAEQLVVSTNTVRTHIKNIYSKLSVHGRSGAVRRGKALELIK